MTIRRKIDWLLCTVLLLVIGSCSDQGILPTAPEPAEEPPEPAFVIDDGANGP